ncbi:MAG: membrane protein insertase YidC, partial [Thiovulaceae bacterium]|nr:membrane protein insertase YidC [Sulfurimonadaceae bacterium]
QSMQAQEKELAKSTLVTLKTDAFTLLINNQGEIASKLMLEKKYHEQSNQPFEVLTTTALEKPLGIYFTDAKVQEEALATPYTTTVSNASISENRPLEVVLTQKLTATTVTKTLHFYHDGHYDVKITMDKPQTYFVKVGHSTRAHGEQMTAEGVMLQDRHDVITMIENGDSEGQVDQNNVRFISSFNRYFTSMFYAANQDLVVTIMKSIDGQEDPIAYILGKEALVFNGYLGPKEYKTLKSISPLLGDSLEYGWFTFIAAPLFWLLQWIFDIVGNWGWAIVIVTIITRILLYPLSYKGMVSMHKLKQVAPKIKELQKKHKGEPQKLNAAMMALYKKEGANPMGGCLPLILQIPIFFAIYRVLLNSIELQGAPWIFWIGDLSVKDPFFILPVIMGATMYYQQKITPNNFTDPMQEKIFKFLPLIMTFFFMFFAAGLVLYWAVNNTLTMIQQYIVNRKFAHLLPPATESKS